MSWISCQKMSALAQTVWELQRFKLWIVISVYSLHPCSYFFPTLKKGFWSKVLYLGVTLSFNCSVKANIWTSLMFLRCVIAIWSQKSRFWEARDETKCFNPENSVIFSLTWFTFWPITQLSDVTAWQVWLEMKAETQGILTHLIRARKNVYLII